MGISLIRESGGVISILADLLTVATSGLAIYVFLKNRAKLAQAVEMLLAYSFQTTLSELKEKLERLNEYNANEPEEVPEIRNILHEIAGQIRGNEGLVASLPLLANKVEELARSKRLTEPSKRSIVSEVREQLRNVQVNAIGRAQEAKK